MADTHVGWSGGEEYNSEKLSMFTEVEETKKKKEKDSWIGIGDGPAVLLEEEKA